MRKVEIAPRTIIFAVLFILGLYFLWIIKDLLFSLLIAFILMSALRPAVHGLENKGVPRKIAAVLVYFLFIFVFVYLFSLIVPPIVIEVTALIRNLPLIVRDVVDPTISQWLQLDTITQYIPNVTQQIFDIIGNVFSNIVFVVSTLFFGFYFIIEEDTIQRFVTKLYDDEKSTKIIATFKHAEKRLSAWFWGQITLMLVIGLLTFIGLSLIGMKYALALAVLAGLLEVVPNLGPTIAAVPAVLIGFSISNVTGLATLALTVIIQQLENAFIVPLIMRRAVGLDPIVTLVALIIGGKIGGVLGVLLAIPILLFVGTFVFEIKKNRDLVDSIL
jgi:predicted PurR-regulated permease PerM